MRFLGIVSGIRAAGDPPLVSRGQDVQRAVALVWFVDARAFGAELDFTFVECVEVAR
jgi:hypothetical protein